MYSSDRLHFFGAHVCVHVAELFLTLFLETYRIETYTIHLLMYEYTLKQHQTGLLLVCVAKLDFILTAIESFHKALLHC